MASFLLTLEDKSSRGNLDGMSAGQFLCLNFLESFLVRLRITCY